MTLEDIVAREAVKQVKAHYCYHLDYKEWEDYANLFTGNATLNVDQGVSTRGRPANPQDEVRGRDAILAFMPGLLGDADTVHQVHSPIIDIISAATAKAIWAMEDIVRLPGLYLEGRGHYRETYAVEDGKWRIASLHLTRTWLKVLRGAEADAVKI